jgi:CHAT domain-containing protein
MLPQEEAALAEEIRQASPRLAALEYPIPLGYSGIVKALEPGTLLIAYAVAEERTHLFALLRSRSGKASLRTAILPVGRGEIERRVRLLRSQLGLNAASRADSQAWKKSAETLFALLLAPAGREIAACKHILLLPDAALHLLPFSVLTPAEKQRPRGLAAKPLGLQKPLSVQPSLTVYASLQADRPCSATPGEATWAGFGDPLYPVGDPDGGREPVDSADGGFLLHPLPGTKEEVLSISALFGGPRSRVFLGREANENAVRTLPRETKYLHFACHGLIDADFPLNSALALSPAPSSEPLDAASRDDHRRDGFLQAWEIIQDLRLDSECAVLSACETGPGKVLGGEGIMGLTRAFFYAGARSVVVSL